MNLPKGLPNCDFCNGQKNGLHRRQYKHPNGERYWVNVCVVCARKNWDFEVKS